MGAELRTGRPVPPLRPPNDPGALSVDGLLRVWWGTLRSERSARLKGWRRIHNQVHDSVRDDLWRHTTMGFRHEHLKQQTPDIEADWHVVTTPYRAATALTGLLPLASLCFWRRRGTSPSCVAW